MPYYPFDSRNSLYQSHIGAVASGTTRMLRLLLHRDACVQEAFFRIKDDKNGQFCEYRMEPGDWLEDYRYYTVSFTPDEGLYWYEFRYTSDFGTFFVVKSDHSLGVVSRTGGDFWQMTVYDASYRTPDWLKGGLIYQIFPDRFYRGHNPAGGQQPDRYYTHDWNAQPIYTQNDPIARLGNDFYGGNLDGIRQKLPYLADLGVTALYLNPIFEAHSNHRYNTADYLKIDPDLGTTEDLVRLCREADRYGMAVILDGVFSHTGSDSLYFNKNGRYETLGAYQSTDSPYASWYHFRHFPDDYDAWWGIDTLPETNETDPDFDRFITGPDGIIRHWLRCGIKGWRLDVADELPDSMIDHIRTAMKDENKDAFLLGEVWEDATNKVSHGGRRRFLRGSQLDSVMNYPFYEAIIRYLTGGNSRDLIDTVLALTENYPPMALHLLMNHIGTHDTPRILTRLGDTETAQTDRSWQAGRHLDGERLAKGLRFVKMAAVLQYTLPGVPSLYYGDEVGMQGYGDPFCRGAFPWGNENTDLLAFYQAIGRMRRNNACFSGGEFVPIYANFGHLVYMRRTGDNAVLVGINRWCDDAQVDIPNEWENGTALFGQPPHDGILTIKKESFCVIEYNKTAD